MKQRSYRAHFVHVQTQLWTLAKLNLQTIGYHEHPCIRSQILDDIPGNFKNEYSKDKEKLKCRHCKSDQVMTQSHCLDCPAWTDIRKDRLVKFFRRLLLERTNCDGILPGHKLDDPKAEKPKQKSQKRVL